MSRAGTAGDCSYSATACFSRGRVSIGGVVPTTALLMAFPSLDRMAKPVVDIKKNDIVTVQSAKLPGFLITRIREPSSNDHGLSFQ